MRVAPYRTTENKILGCVITLVDVTTQKQGLAMLKSTEQQLSLAQQAITAKSDFLSRISHEISTPLATISKLLDQAAAQKSDAAALNESIEQITETVKYMSSIVSDISEMSKGDLSGDSSETFVLKDVIDIVNDLMCPSSKVAGIDFSVVMDGTFSPTYCGNRLQLQQILVNFLTDSINHTKSGGTIALRAHEDAIIGNQSSLCFTIKDNGVGYTVDELSNLFKSIPVTHAPNDAVSEQPNFGLSIAYNLIQLMGGDVKVESDPKKGSTFTIHVILNRREALTTPEIPKTEEASLNGLHALVVDDNAMNRTILNTILSHQGITSTEACDGLDALKLFLDSPVKTFDCILMDIRMPNMDGIEAATKIRTSGKEDALSIPIIGVSANGFTDDIEKAREARINYYTTKPIDANKLFSSLKECLEKK